MYSLTYETPTRHTIFSPAYTYSDVLYTLFNHGDRNKLPRFNIKPGVLFFLVVVSDEYKTIDIFIKDFISLCYQCSNMMGNLFYNSATL